MCCRILLASGIKAIKYINDYRNDDLVMRFTNEMGISVDKF
jgi:deoxycytidylate deaminase